MRSAMYLKIWHILTTLMVVIMLISCGSQTIPESSNGQVNPSLINTPIVSASSYPAEWIDQVDVNKELYYPPLAIGEAVPIADITKDKPISDVNGNTVLFTGQRTVLVLSISKCAACEDQLPMVKQWAADLPAVHIVYAVRGPELATTIQSLQTIPNLTIVDDTDKRLAAGLKGRAGPTTFLINEKGIVEWRMTAFYPWFGATLDNAVRQFAANQTITGDYQETNYTSPGIIPAFMLRNIDGQSVNIAEFVQGSPALILLLRSNCPDCDEVVNEVFALLAERNDSNVKLVLVLDSLSDDERQRSQNYVATYNLGVTTQTIASRRDDPSGDIARLRERVKQQRIQTQVILDPESKVATHWTTPSVPMAFFINKNSEIIDFLPFFWFSKTETDKPTVQPSIDVMNTLLDKLSKKGGK